MLRIVSNKHDRIESLMKSIGVDKYGVDIMLPKADELVIKTGNISTIAANVLKQHLLSLGGDAAVARWSITGSKKPTDCLITANGSQLNRLIDKLQNQPFGLKKLSQDLKETIQNYKQSSFILKAGKFRVDLGRQAKVMGIINATHDSFSGDGIYSSGFEVENDKIISIARNMVRDGADIIDIGGESTRPGSDAISAKEELRRILPVIKAAAKNINIPISVDTYKSQVAEAALDNGAVIINDISGLRFDKKLAKIIAKYKAAVVLMHTLGRPKTMQKNIVYSSLVDEIMDYLGQSIQIALDAGICKDSILIDPGIGFGKTREHNLEIINNLSEFKSLGFPIMIGPSRKSFIGLTLKKKENERIMGTAACVTACILNGASLVRVHDVKLIKEVVKMSEAIKRN